MMTLTLFEDTGLLGEGRSYNMYDHMLVLFYLYGPLYSSSCIKLLNSAYKNPFSIRKALSVLCSHGSEKYGSTLCATPASYSDERKSHLDERYVYHLTEKGIKLVNECFALNYPFYPSSDVSARHDAELASAIISILERKWHCSDLHSISFERNVALKRRLNNIPPQLKDCIPDAVVYASAPGGSDKASDEAVVFAGSSEDISNLRQTSAPQLPVNMRLFVEQDQDTERANILVEKLYKYCDFALSDFSNDSFFTNYILFSCVSHHITKKRVAPSWQLSVAKLTKLFDLCCASGSDHDLTKEEFEKVIASSPDKSVASTLEGYRHMMQHFRKSGITSAKDLINMVLTQRRNGVDEMYQAYDREYQLSESLARLSSVYRLLEEQLKLDRSTRERKVAGSIWMHAACSMMHAYFFPTNGLEGYVSSMQYRPEKAACFGAILGMGLNSKDFTVSCYNRFVPQPNREAFACDPMYSLPRYPFNANTTIVNCRDRGIEPTLTIHLEDIHDLGSWLRIKRASEDTFKAPEGNGKFFCPFFIMLYDRASEILEFYRATGVSTDLRHTGDDETNIHRLREEGRRGVLFAPTRPVKGRLYFLKRSVYLRYEPRTLKDGSAIGGLSALLPDVAGYRDMTNESCIVPVVF